MRLDWRSLSEVELLVYRTTAAFLKDRLEERETVDWALRLGAGDKIKRFALVELLDTPSAQKTAEPWRSAWRLIQEDWANASTEDRTSHSMGAYHVKRRLASGERSGSLVTAIVELVAPVLRVEEFSNLRRKYQPPPRRPQKVEDLLAVKLASGEIVDLDVLNLEKINERSFLLSLALELEAAVVRGLDVAKRIGSDKGRWNWALGQLNRVYYVSPSERPNEEHEPDRFHRGIAPSVKLLHAAVSHLAGIDLPAAAEFARRWKITSSPVHLRLWAAMARDSRIASGTEVGALLLALDDRAFWDKNLFPEIAELRAKRFGELDEDQQVAITARIRKRPPRNHWPRETEPERVESAREYWAVRELKRIAVAGGNLPESDKSWLAAKVREFSDLNQMNRVDDGFMTSPKARWVPPNPDSRYNNVSGLERLKMLEEALSSGRMAWDDDPSARAADWIRVPENYRQLTADFERSPSGGADFPKVWRQFGWVHSPAKGDDENKTQGHALEECSRVLSLLVGLPSSTIHQAIDGISHWLSTWQELVVTLPTGLDVWLKVWPIAVEATNEAAMTQQDNTADFVSRPSVDQEPKDLDTLNTPVGKLVGVFFSACPNLGKDDRPFEVNIVAGKMRDMVIAASGLAKVIARYRMIESLSYFLRADPKWTQEFLITPLMSGDADAITLWRAISRQTRFFDVLMEIGPQMVQRATDSRLGREARRSLVFSLVIECLHALLEERNPAVPYTDIQQMIRSLDDEVRGYAAEAVKRFVESASRSGDAKNNAPSAEKLFVSAAAPFLQQVWPQERSLATPGVSRALADLPAAARGEFVAAVSAIDRFLVPFECWSMIEYGLFGDENGRAKLSAIDSYEKAVAFLRLLDRTIGSSEGSVVPSDLADALAQVRQVAPALAESQIFRRLATMAR